VQVPEPQTVTVQVVEGVPALLNLYLALAVSDGTVKVRVQDGSAESVICAPFAEMDVGTTLHPETEIVAEMLVPMVVIVTGCATCADVLCRASTIITHELWIVVLVSKVTVAPERVELTVSYSTEPTSLFAFWEMTRAKGTPAVSELGPPLPTIPMSMSLALDVVTPVTVGCPMPPAPRKGRPVLGSNGVEFIPENPAAIMSTSWVPVPDTAAVIVSEVMFEAPTLAYHSSISCWLPWLSDTLRLYVRPVVSVMVVTLFTWPCVTRTRMKSLLRQFVRVTLIVLEVELALLKQSKPFTKLAVTVPPPLTVAVTGFEETPGAKVIDVVLDVQAVNV
jgi:hypothetical protein